MYFKRLIWWILAKVKTLFLRLPYFNKSFLILSSGRSGSTLLVQLLNNHRSIHCHGELLNREDLQADQLGRGTNSRTLVNYILAKLLPLNPWLSLTGFKCFNEQLEYCNISLRTILHSLYSPPVVVLYRRNLMETFVSLKIAQANDIWFSETIVNSCTIELDWNELMEYCEDEKRRWRNSLKSIPSSCRLMLLSFEELAENRDESLRRVFGFLGVKSCKVFATSKRQNPKPLDEKVTNYKDIVMRSSSEKMNFEISEEWIKNCLHFSHPSLTSS